MLKLSNSHISLSLSHSQLSLFIGVPHLGMLKEENYGGTDADKENEGDEVADSSANQSHSTPRFALSQSDEIYFNFLHQPILHGQDNRRSMPVTHSEAIVDNQSANSFSTENRVQETRFVLEYQQLYNQYAMLIARLQESIGEVESLRLENDDLRFINSDLMKRLSLLSQATIQNCLLSSSGRAPLTSIANDMNRLNLGGSVVDDLVNGESSSVSPISTIEQDQFEGPDVDRVSLPKSISVRSSGYLTISHRGGSRGGPSRGAQSKYANSSGSQQRVYVPRGKREEEAMEFEVYNQGMFKTELCNKWQETGKCPYGEQCQFAHGITELRPVIRHPRYKTEVCRMVLAGVPCPYGHRCHFRHSLTDQERLLGPLAFN